MSVVKYLDLTWSWSILPAHWRTSTGGGVQQSAYRGLESEGHLTFAFCHFCLLT